jgi:class 3 adenylate cyclase/tetratricopeptide (TPR) repeat protein
VRSGRLPPRLAAMRVCPSCGAENPDEARFCMACASPVTEPQRGREVRKSVTVVFCDVTGSTALGELLDPETLRRVMRRYFDTMKIAIEHHGGTVEKFIGDAVMAVFGIPHVHEDDALRAARAAIEMREGLLDLNKQLERDHGVTLASRIGVNTGEVVAGDPTTGQALVTGDAVNIAARLEQAAAAGEILIGEQTYLLTRDAIRAERADPIAAKGKTEPVLAYRLQDVSAGAPGHTRRLDAPMVGRDRELALLGQAFERVTTDRACHLFTVLATAGAGKTRLVEEFAAQVDANATVLRGRCLAYGEGITFWPVAELVGQAAGLSILDPPGEAKKKLLSVIGPGERSERVADLVACLVGLSETQAPVEESFWALRRFLEILATPQPLLLLLDDLQWAEPTFLDLVEHVAEWSRDAPILILAQARPELRDDRSGWGGGVANATSILLEPLTEAETVELIADLIGDAEIAGEVSARVAEAAEGNPLFVEEMVAMLIDDGYLVRDDHRWVADGDLSEVKVPPTVHALIAARLDRLSALERAVLERAAVIGKVFVASSIRSLLREELSGTVDDGIRALLRKDLIRPDRGDLGEEDAYRFRHLLVRDAIYEAMPKELRASLHEGFAEWLEREARSAGELDEFVGYHLERSYRYREELGPVDDAGRAIADRAGARLLAAGERAMGRGDLAAAEQLLGRAMALLPTDDPRALSAMPSLGQALYYGGQLERALDYVEEASVRAANAGAETISARLAILRVLIRNHLDPDWAMQPALMEVESHLTSLEAAGDDLGSAEAWSTVGVFRFWLGDGAGGLEAIERGHAHAVRAGSERLIRSTSNELLGPFVWGPVPSDEVVRRASGLIAEMEAGGSDSYELSSSLGVAHAMRGEVELADERFEMALTRARELGDRLPLAAAHPQLEAGLMLGRFAETERLARGGIEQLREMGEHGYLSTSLIYLAEAIVSQDRPEEAEMPLKEAEEQASEGDAVTVIGIRRVRAKIARRQGRLDEAERHARGAIAAGEATDYLYERGISHLELGEILLAKEERDEGLEQLRVARELFERKGVLVRLDALSVRIAEVEAR